MGRGLLIGVLLTLVCAPASAADLLQEQAKRQLEFAWSELEAGDFERALESADRVLAADPALYEARLVLALAYAGKKDWARAQFALEEYVRALTGLAARAEAAELAETLKKKRRWDGPIPQVKGAESAESKPDTEVGVGGPSPLLVAGLVSAGLGAGLGAGAIAAGAEAERLRADYYDGGTHRDAFPALVEQWEGARSAATILGLAAVTAGVAGAVLVPVGASGAGTPVAVIPVVGPQHVGVAIGGAW